MNKKGYISYSIIVPHKNTPELLKRCIDSIPKRDDVQIIIVDDNSDASIVDFSNFPGQEHPLTEVYFTKENRGAGFARNFGLMKARGRWLIFADSDDFFNDCLNQKMNEYLNSTADIIFFQSNSVVSDTMNRIESRGKEYNAWLQESKKRDIVLDEVRYKINPPWSKFYSTNLVREHGIKFDEVLVANDVMFSTKCGFAAKKIIIDLSYLYCSTVRQGSLDLTNIDAYVWTRFEIALNHFVFLKKIKKEKYRMNIFNSINMIRKLNNWTSLKDSFINAYHEMGLINITLDFFEILKHKIKK
ncbi:MAG: hypothetical protein PETM_00108 [Petrimonas sp.]|jgi:glycosyltransferase involved in cell wall biosynthesis|uniref:glycosyltransferase family A protein n=1 Tax=Petrimonas sp. TaxID=2023866 RepID=UPI0030D30059